MPYLIEVSLCSLLFIAIYLLFFKGKKNHFGNRAFILGSLVMSFAIPILNIPLWPEYITVTPLENIPSDEITGQRPISDGLNYLLIITAIYLVGLIYNLFIFLTGLFQIRSVVKSGNKKKEQNLIKVITSKEHPLSSFLHYIFIPDHRSKDISEYELSHEQCHINQKHSWDILLIELVKSTLWFNPAIYIFRKELRTIHEYLADDFCIKKFGQNEYQEFLIQQILATQRPTLVHTFNSLLKQRIQMMNTNNTISKWRYLLAFPIILSCLALFSFKSYPVVEYEKNEITLVQDTIIPKMRLSSFIDTIITFDPVTGKETVEVVERKITYADNIEDDKIYDTLTLIHSISGERNTFVLATEDNKGVNLEVKSENAIDTVTVFDPHTYFETQVAINTLTGKVDTIYKDRSFKKEKN